MNTLTNFNEQLFTELTPIEAAIILGGGEFKVDIPCDDSITSPNFNVSSGGTIKLSSFITSDSPENISLLATLQNLNTGESLKKFVKIGNYTTSSLKDLSGGNYRLKFTDPKDGICADGHIVVNYT